MLERKVKLVIGTLFDMDQDEIRDDSGPESIALWDSLNHLRMITELEKVFQVRFSIRAIRSMVTVRKIKDVLMLHLDGRNITQEDRETDSK